MPRFETLPTELLLGVMQSVDSLHDLSSLLRTFRRCWSGFNERRETVLWSVLQRSVNPSSLRYAAASVNIPDVRRVESMHERQVIMARFMTANVLGNCKPRCPSSYEDVVRIVKLHGFVDRIINHLIGDLMPLLSPRWQRVSGRSEGTQLQLLATGQSKRASGSQQQLLRLSRSEQGRLEKAVYRLEIFSKAFKHLSIGRGPWGGVPLAVAMLPDIFPGNLQPWEVEELACLVQYFDFKATDLWVQIDLQLHRELKAHVIQGLDGTSPQPGQGVAPIPSVDIGTTQLRMFGWEARDSGDLDEGLLRLGTLGVEFLEELISPETSVDRRCEMMRYTKGSSDQVFLWDILASIKRRHLRREPANPPAYQPDDLLGPNGFYESFRGSDEFWQDTFIDPTESGLLKMLFVFWDTERLVNSRLNLERIEQKLAFWYAHRDMEIQPWRVVISTATLKMLGDKYGPKEYGVDDAGEHDQGS